MRSVPLFRTRSLQPLLSLVERSGARPERVFGRALPMLRAPNALLPLAEGGRAYEAAARHLGSDVGLRAAESISPEAIGGFGALLRSARTVGEALRLAVAHGSRFNSGQRISVEARRGGIWLHYALTPSLEQGRPAGRDFAVSLLLALVRLAAGPGWRPAELHLEGPPPAHAEKLAALAERATCFGGRCNAIVLAPDVLALSLPHLAPAPSPDTAALPSPDLATSLRQVIEALLPLGELDARAVADCAGLSLRSFERGLAAARLSFRRLVQQVRLERALRLLADPRMKVIEVANALAYTNAANFTRAFRRWTGVSPQTFRAPGRGITSSL